MDNNNKLILALKVFLLKKLCILVNQLLQQHKNDFSNYQCC